MKYILLLSILIASCNSTEKISKNNSEIKGLKLESFSRGYYESIEINSAQLRRKIEGVSRKENFNKTISEDDWGMILSLIQNLELEEMSNYEAPSNENYSDASVASKLLIETNDSTFNSVQFDRNNPPKELIDLIIKVNSLGEF